MGGKHDPSYKLVVDPRIRAARATANISNQIKLIREKLGFTRSDWAPKVGVNVTRLRKMELGGARPSLKMLAAIVAIVGKPVFEVFTVGEAAQEKASLAIAASATPPPPKVATPRKKPGSRGRARADVPSPARPAAEVVEVVSDGPRAVTLEDLIPADLRINLLAPPVTHGAHLATAQAPGRRTFSATGPTAGAALASAIAQAQADRSRLARVNA
jgi:DNA-binding XRE family transcriptional regulator